jgi:acetyltransferase-like isoleucine patch superfamily enzyme
MIKFLKKLYSIIIKTQYWFRVWRLNLKEGMHVDTACVIHPKTFIKIWKGGSMAIGSKTEVLPGVMIFTYGGDITIGRNCSINSYAVLYGHGGLKIGDNVLVAGGTMIIPSSHVFTNPEIPIIRQGSTAKGITIEDDVWIGHGCSILDGVTIGKGSVIAAGSVVNKDVAPYTIVGGVPAQELKKRR